MTADRFDPDATADGTAERSAELTDEFWGERPEWTPQRPPAPARSGFGSTIGRWWGSVLGGGVTAERAHGRATSPSSTGLDSEDTTEARVADEPGDADLDDWTFDPEPAPERRGGVDPLLARLGGLAVIVTLAAPLIVGFTASDDDAATTALSEPTGLIATVDAALEPASTAPVAAPAPSAAAPATTPPVVSAPTTPEANTSPTSSPADDASGSAVTEPPIAASAALDASPDPDPEPAPTTLASTAPACGSRYDVAAGDYWIRLADAADVPLSDLLAVNGASVDTVLVPGDSICLPVGAATPAPPPTSTAPPTTSPASNNSSSNNSSPPRTATTTTTTAPAPTTTAPVRPAAVPTSQAVQIIRDAWPDELEERAIEIAWRESNHRSNVNNWCCYGLFQIHWNAHKSWLGTVGITSVSQLYDPVLNANAAYVLYQRSGGFGPWGG